MLWIYKGKAKNLKLLKWPPPTINKKNEFYKKSAPGIILIFITMFLYMVGLIKTVKKVWVILRKTLRRYNWTVWFIDLQIDWFKIVWLIDWLIDWLINWLT